MLYKFIRFGGCTSTKPYKFIGFGGGTSAKPYKFIGFGGGRSPFLLKSRCPLAAQQKPWDSEYGRSGRPFVGKRPT
jgi:hypothetical protein